MRKFSQKFKTGASVAAVVVVLFGDYSYRKLQALAADPSGEKDCGLPVGGDLEYVDSGTLAQAVRERRAM